MPYDSSGPNDHPSPDAADASPGGDPNAGSDAQEESDETITVPQSCLNGKDYSPGDTITFKVTGKNSDGDLEVCLGDDESSEGSGDNSDEQDAMEMRQALGASKAMAR